MTATILGVGHKADLPMERYVCDDVGAPVATLNSGTANKLLSRSPLHAWIGHPKLNPDWQEDYSDAFDLGTAAHAMLLEGKDVVVVVDAKDWRSGAAQQSRDDIRAEGMIPLLAPQAEAVFKMTAAALLAIETSPDLRDLGPLEPERTLVWEQGGAWLRCRPDWMTLDRSIILSYKTTSQNAEPSAYARTLLNSGHELQAAFEMAGVESTEDVYVANYVWIVQEVQAPYAVSLVGMAPEMRDYGEGRMRAAVDIWRDCLARDRWPGYPNRICYPEVPPWVATQWAERMEMAQ